MALMLSVAGVWSIFEFSSIGSRVTSLLDENYQSISYSNAMVEALEREDSGTLLLLMGHWEDGRKTLADADSIFRANLNLAYSNVTILGEEEILDTIKNQYFTYKKIWERPIVGTDKQGQLAWYYQNIHPEFLTVKSTIQKLAEINVQTMYETSSDLKDKANRAVMPGIIAIISALIFTLIFNFLVDRFMVSPIIKMTDRVKLFKQKRVPFDVSIDTKDEIRDLQESIRDLCEIVSSGD